MFFKVRIDQSQPQYFISTEVDINTPWRQVSSRTQKLGRATIYTEPCMNPFGFGIMNCGLNIWRLFQTFR